MKKLLMAILTITSIALLAGCESNQIDTTGLSTTEVQELHSLPKYDDNLITTNYTMSYDQSMDEDTIDEEEDEEVTTPTPTPTPTPTLTPMQKKYKNYDRGYEDLSDTCPDPDKVYYAKTTKQINKLEQHLKDAGYYNEWYGEDEDSDSIVKITDTKRNGKKYGVVCVADYLDGVYVFYYYFNDPDSIYCDEISHGNEGIYSPELYASREDGYFLTVTYDEVQEYLASLNPEEDQTNKQAFTSDQIYGPAQEKAKQMIASYLNLDQLDMLASYFSFEDINDAYFEYDEEDNSYYLNFEVYWMEGDSECYFWVQSEFVYKNNTLSLRHMDVDEE